MRKKIALAIMPVVTAGLLMSCDDGGMRLNASLPNDGEDPFGTCQPFGGDDCIRETPEQEGRDDGDDGSGDNTAVYKTLQCPYKAELKGKTGESFSQPILMRGGSGNFQVVAKDSVEEPFPAWLAITGTAIKAPAPPPGHHDFTLIATDKEADMEVECDFSVKIPPVIPALVTQLSKVGTSQIQASLALDGLDGTGSSSTVQSKDDSTTGPPPSNRTPTETPGRQRANSSTTPPSVTSLQIQLTTGGPVIHGNTNWSETKCTVDVRFCKTANVDDTNCTSPETLAPKAGFVSGQTASFHSASRQLSSLFPNLSSDHRYFSITLNEGDGACAKDTYMFANDAWLLRMIDVRMQLSDGTEYRYLNPCVGRWMSPGDTLRFGPNDTAICAVITTAGTDGAGTDDDVFLLVDVDTDIRVTGIDWQQGSKSTEWGPHHVSDTNQAQHPLLLNWRDSPSDNYDDFEAGMTTSYGFSVFDSNPFGTSFQLSKGNDGENGPWTIGGYKVYLYHPGHFGEGDNQILAVKEDEMNTTLSMNYQKTNSATLGCQIGVEEFITIGQHH